jgi:hypothetical protein
MAVYKVPQDVEADDKLIGPFSFRQFIYLIIVAMASALAWGLAQLFVPLAIIPLPIILFFGAIALPLRKDQPMEIYMAAMWSFFLKPHMRKWDPDGLESLIEVTAPKSLDIQFTKDISQDEAQRRLDYLAGIVDSRGWAIRGPQAQVSTSNSPMISDVYLDAQKTEDILDSSTHRAQTLNQKLDQSDNNRMDEIKKMMSERTSNLNYFSNPQKPSQAPVEDNLSASEQPIGQLQEIIEPSAKTEPNTSNKTTSADIINLANSTDLSIATIAGQANRISDKQNQEVFISLR